MMDSLRKVANSTAFKIIFALIILSFIFAGIGGIFSPDFGRSGSYVAKVNGEKISKADFEALFNTSGRGVGYNNLKNEEDKRQWRKSFLDRVINDTLGYTYAQKLGFRITDDEIKDYIRQQSQFKENG